MKPVHYGRKVYSFGRGATLLTNVVITEKPILGENEKEFKDRLLAKYHNKEGTFEIVIKNGRPSHAIVTIN